MLYHRLHSQIWTSWNSNNYKDLSALIREQPCMQMDFWQFSRNADMSVIPEKLSENYVHAWLFSNPCGQVLKSIKLRGYICPILLRRKGTFPLDWITTMHANGFWTIFQEYYVCQHSWKIFRNPFACMVVFQSMWKGPNYCWNFMESRSESATYTTIIKYCPLIMSQSLL